MKKSLSILVTILLILAAAAAFLFCGYKLLAYVHEAHRRDNHQAQLAQHVQEIEPQSESAGQTPALPMQVDFATLQAECADIKGWLTCPDTQLNDPVVRGEDNAYYERRLTDGSWNMAGTLFMDFQNEGDFADPLTIIYGHNMQNHTMFGNLEKYKEQDYYEENPVMWLFTPDKNYIVHLAAGITVAADDACYNLPQTAGQRNEFLRTALAQSTFTAPEPADFDANWVLLSTCSYVFEDARYIVLGYLEPV